MANGNQVTIVGNATRDPELKFTPSGTSVATFGVACNRRWQNRQTNEWEEDVSFFDVTVWSQLSENTAASVRKGDRVMVNGRLDQRTWEDKETGQNRSKVEVVADDVAISLRYGEVTDFKKNEKTGDQGGQDDQYEQQAPPPAQSRGQQSNGNGGRGRQQAPAGRGQAPQQGRGQQQQSRGGQGSPRGRQPATSGAPYNDPDHEPF